MHVRIRVYNYSNVVFACLLAKLTERKAQESGAGICIFSLEAMYLTHICRAESYKCTPTLVNDPRIGGVEVEPTRGILERIMLCFFTYRPSARV